MKELKVSDETGKIRRPSRDIMREALAHLGLAGRITHRIGAHSHQYHGVAVSPDGSKMITANRDHTARLWDIASGQCLMVFEGHTGELRRAAFMHDGTRAVTTADDKTLRLWDCLTGICILVLEPEKNQGIDAVAVSPDDRHIITSGFERRSQAAQLHVWSLPGGICEHVVENAGGRVSKLLVTGNGSALLTLHSHGPICRWNFPDIGDPYLIASARPLDAFRDIVLAGEAEVVAAAGSSLSCFNILTGGLERSFSFEPHEPYRVTVTPDSDKLVACCRDGTILVADRRTGAVEKEFPGHRWDDVTGMALAPDGKTLCTVSLDYTCRVWDAAAGRCLRIIKPVRNLGELSVSRDGTHLAARDAGGAVKVWNVVDGSLRVLTKKAASLTFLALPDLIATGHRNGEIRLWQGLGGGTEPVSVLKAHSYPVDCLAPLRSGASLVSCAYDGLRLWDARTGDCTGTSNIPEKAVRLAVDEHTERVAVGRLLDSSILVLDLRSGDRLALLKGHTFPPKRDLFVTIQDVRFVSRGRALVSCARDGRLILWDLSTFQAVKSMERENCDIVCMTVEEDERHVIVGTMNQGVQRWDLESGRQEVLYPSNGLGVFSLALSPDQKRLFSSFSDGTVRIFDRDSGALVCSLWNVDEGFFWFTPPDKHAPDGWVWTNRDDLLHVVEEGGDGSVLGAVPLSDDRRGVYIHTRNNAAMVQARLKGLDEYARMAARYTRALADKQREVIARPGMMLPKGDGNG